jgi:tetratricopeptide (TPR) repeat protein/TolB-like protein
MSAVVAERVASRRAADAARVASGARAAQAASRPSLAVPEFLNLTRKPDDEWLSTAMAEMLTTELAGDGQLRVVPGDLVARAARGVPRSDDARLRARVGTDLLVRGSFGVAGDPAHPSVRIDVRIERAAGDAISVASVGDEAQLFSVIADVGRQLRSHLGLRESPAEATDAARAAFPRGLDATKRYAEGMAHLRRLEPVAARESFEQAAAREPENPLIQTALASAWTMLGYDGRAEAAAKKAFDASGALTREDRLAVEGRLYEAQHQPAKAIDVYRTLWGFFADNVEYGLRLASAQTLAGRGREALATIDAMRHAPAPQNQDPRIDLAEAEAQSALGDFPRELAALERALTRASENGATLVEARARLLEGRSFFSQGQPDRAVRSLESARQMFVDAGDKAGAASALNSLATVLSDQQDISRAQRMYEESLAASEEIGDRRGMSAALNNLGILFKDQRQYAEARQAHERALALRREIGDRNWTAISLSNIGVVLFEQDQLREAAKYYNESLAICRDIGDKRGQVRALHNLAIVEREVGQLAPARAAFEESLATRAEIGDKRGMAIGQIELGTVLLAQAELARARQTEEGALRLARETRLKPGEAQALYLLGEISLAAGEMSEARRSHEQALALRREMKETRTVLESELALAAVTLEEGRAADAEREAVRLAESLGKEPPGPPHVAVQLLIARARLARGDLDAAARALADAQRIGRSSERIDVRQELAMVDAELGAARGRSREAHDQLARLLTTLGRSGMVLAQLQTRLLLLQIDGRERRASVRADARALEKDAQAHRAGLVARRAQAIART